MRPQGVHLRIRGLANGSAVYLCWQSHADAPARLGRGRSSMKYGCRDSRVVAGPSGRRSYFGRIRVRIAPGILTNLLFFCAFLFAQTPATRPKAAPKASSPTSAGAEQKLRYKAIWEPINYKEDVNLADVFFATDQVGWIAGVKDGNKGGF